MVYIPSNNKRQAKKFLIVEKSYVIQKLSRQKRLTKAERKEKKQKRKMKKRSQ